MACYLVGISLCVCVSLSAYADISLYTLSLTHTAPRPLFEIGARYYGQLRNERTVKAMLGMVYANENAFGDRLVSVCVCMCMCVHMLSVIYMHP